MREVVSGCFDKVGWTADRADVGLDWESADIMLRLEFGGKFGGELGRGVGCIIQDYGGTLCCEVSGDGGANA